MKIEFDPEKRNQTLKERGLDFKQAGEIFTGLHFTLEDRRKDYGEQRWITVGRIGKTMVVSVWTQRGTKRRMISLRKANAREQKKIKAHLDRS